MATLVQCLMGNREPCQLLVPPRRPQSGGLPADDRDVMSLARLFLFPEQRAPGQLRASRASDERPLPRTSGSLSACYWASVASETGLESWGNGHLQLVPRGGLSHAGASQIEQDEEEDGRPIQQPLSQSQSQAPDLSHARGWRLRSCTLDLVGQYARVVDNALPASGTGVIVCLFDSALLLVEAAHLPHGLVGLILSFSSENHTVSIPTSTRVFQDILLNTRHPRLWCSLLRAVLTPTPDNLRVSALNFRIRNRVSGRSPTFDSAHLDYRGPAHRVRQIEPGTVRWLLPLLALKRPGREKYPIEKRPGF